MACNPSRKLRKPRKLRKRPKPWKCKRFKRRKRFLKPYVPQMSFRDLQIKLGKVIVDEVPFTNDCDTNISIEAERTHYDQEHTPRISLARQRILLFLPPHLLDGSFEMNPLKVPYEIIT
jgi:hypothetical protein